MRLTTTLHLVAAALLCFSSAALAKTVKIPAKNPAVIVTIPDDWEPETVEQGYACESPDQVATVLFEVTTPDGLDALIDENVDWLIKEHEVKINEKSEDKQTFKAGSLEWSRISWKADHKEWGKSRVAFLFAAVGDGKVLTVTYWLTEKDLDKHIETITKMFESVDPVE